MTLEEFMKIPSREEWERELAEGWPGSDGSTSSTDSIFGVEIGKTGKDHKDCELPATLHDWRYRLGRRYGLPEAYQLAADIEYRDGCIAATDRELTSFCLRALARGRARARYYTLRAFGKHAFTGDAKLKKGKEGSV